jgi:ElaB/YqjD/DUF883 family membrane-anchored ribosome-binding protein
MRADTAEQAKRIAQKFRRTRAEMAEMIREVFGEVTEELEKDYLEIRGEIMALVEEMKDSGELTKEKYNQAVDTVVSQFAKGRRWSRTASKKLINSLEDEWNNINS